MKIIFIGDIFGRPGRRALKNLLPKIKETFSPDFVVANGENAAHGAGITPKVAEEIFSSGVDVITGGNHSFDKRVIWDEWDKFPFLLRPLNFPEQVPGKGFAVSEKNGFTLGVINLQGRVSLPPTNSPFETLDKIIKEIDADAVLVDFHGEATSEKIAFGYYANGKVSAVLGTHTHIQTNDARILDKGTAYITDVGMCGTIDSVIGLDRDVALRRFLTLLPYGFKVGDGRAKCDFVYIETDNNGKAVKIEPHTIAEED